MAKQVMTVLGPVAPDELGPTLAHEHILVDLSCNFVYPEEASLKRYLHEPVQMPMLGLLRRRPFSVCLDNVSLTDEDLAIRELSLFKRAGGGALVDCTVIGIGRDPLAVQRVSRATGLHVIQGTGIYVEPSHPDWVETMGIDELAELFVREIRVGIGDTGVRAGIIGEIGTSGVSKAAADYKRVGDLTPNEEKVLRAAGRASLATGAAVTIHLDIRGQGAYRVIDVLEEEGIAPDRMIMDHMDPVVDLDYHLAVAARGVFVEYDCFGREYYSEELARSFNHDVRRIESLCALLEAGYEDQLLLSQDICMKMDLRRYGGQGYDHILTAVLPMLRRAGVTEGQIHKLLIENPRRALAFEVEGAGAQRGTVSATAAGAG